MNFIDFLPRDAMERGLCSRPVSVCPSVRPSCYPANLVVLYQTVCVRACARVCVERAAAIDNVTTGRTEATTSPSLPATGRNVSLQSVPDRSTPNRRQQAVTTRPLTGVDSDDDDDDDDGGAPLSGTDLAVVITASCVAACLVGLLALALVRCVRYGQCARRMHTTR